MSVKEERELHQVNRLYALLSQVNHTVVRVKDQQTLFDTICRAATEQGQFRMVWIGLADAQGTVRPVAQAGAVNGYLDHIVITHDDAHVAKGPTGVALRERRLDVCEDIAVDARMAPWRHEALSRGYLSSAAVPFVVGGRLIGVLSLYAPEPGFFSTKECDLVRAIGEDLSFALESMELAHRHAAVEAQLARAQRLESIGRLAGSVAHDFNNLLSVILTVAETALLTAPAGPMRDDFEQIQDAAKRSAELTRSLLAFARKQPSAARVLPLDEAIGGVLKVLRTLAGEGVRLAWEPGGVGAVMLDPSHLDQVLTNLVANGRDAMGGRGTLTLRTRLEEVDAGAAALGELKQGRWVALSVSDEGPGFSAAALEHLYEPFFTTKVAGRGTGLGLATVYGLVRQAKGEVQLESVEGRGSTVTVRFPSVEG